MAACLWAGEQTAASHRTAATLWRLDGFARGRVEIATTCRRRPHGLPVVVHRFDRWLLADITTIEGIPVTSLRRTLLDLAGIKDRRLEGALDHALGRGLTSLGGLWLLYEAEWTRGRRGIAILRHLLAERTTSTAPTQSALERMYLRIVEEYALPAPVRQYAMNLSWGQAHIDFAYPRSEVAIEIDSHAWHMDRKSFERDRERDNELQQLGWQVLRFTWAKLRWEPERVAALVSAALAKRGRVGETVSYTAPTTHSAK